MGVVERPFTAKAHSAGHDHGRVQDHPSRLHKKWLGYRQADRRDGKPLTDIERHWFREMIQRIAALLALGSKLDSLYQAAAGDGFTAEELKIER